MKKRYDVLIVGAGPAGSVSAMSLARKGFSVLLLDKSDFPRDKSCGDGLTRTSTKLLSQLGLWHRFEKFQKIAGVKVFIENEGFRQFDYPEYLSHPGHGLVVPRIKLDTILWEEAVAEGADFKSKVSFKQLIWDEAGKVIGVELVGGERYFADLVIGADGAASRIAYQANLASTPKNRLGFGIRAYYSNVDNLNERLELFLPILDNSKKRVLPSYGWVFPLGNNTVNIGVGLIEKTDANNIRSVMDMFVKKLRNTDSRFEKMKLEGNYLGAPMRFDFKPDNTYCPGLLLVGDAAGMISPFTGEGIGYAIETGTMAAELFSNIKKSKNLDCSNLSEYGRQLASKYQGYFETGTTSISRYHLVWKVLKSTFQNDEPLFSTIRQATVFPEGIGESFFDQYTENIADLIVKHKGALRTDLLSIADRIINITREDWPFLSRLFTASQVTPGIPFRPSLFLLLSGYDEQVDRNILVKLGTALELGFASTICHDSVIDNEAKHLNGNVNWGNMIAILVGDFLLGKSFEIVAGLDSKFTRFIADAMGSSNEGMVRLRQTMETKTVSCSIDEYLQLCYQKQGYAFELCSHLGAIVKQADATEVKALREFGKYFAASYFIVEDTMNHWTKKRADFKVEVANPLYLRDERMSLIRLLLRQNQSKGDKQEVAYECVQKCFAVARNEMEKAKVKLESIHDQDTKNSFLNLCHHVIEKTLKLELV